MRRRSRSSESGATAVVTAVLVVAVFLPLTALAVDLGNAWARGRAVQRQADLSAIGAGYLLPMRAQPGHSASDIAAKVAELLSENAAAGQAPSGDGQLAVTAAQLLDDDLSNGEVQFFTDPDLEAPCTDKCAVMRVLPPPAQVRFAFAVALPGGGIEGTAVQRTAVVEVESQLPPPNKVLPFWLPNGCGYGAAQPDTSQGNGGQSTATSTPTASATSGSTAFSPALSDTGSHQVSGTSTTAGSGTTVTLTGYAVTGIANNTDRASLRFVSPAGSSYVEYAATPLEKKQNVLNVPSFQVGPEVTDTAGVWQIYAMVESNGRVRYSANHLELSVGAGAPENSLSRPPRRRPPMCRWGVSGQDRGNFGQLEVPRGDSYNALAANIALGLDHRLAPFVWGSTQTRTKDCGSTQHGFIDNAHPDTEAGRTEPEPRNCITGDTGNDGPRIYDGLVTGEHAGGVGRLEVSHGGAFPGCGTAVSAAGESS